MNIYAAIILLILVITLLYTYQHDTSMFLFILLLISICLYINYIVSNSLSILKNEIINNILQIIHLNSKKFFNQIL